MESYRILWNSMDLRAQTSDLRNGCREFSKYKKGATFYHATVSSTGSGKLRYQNLRSDCVSGTVASRTGQPLQIQVLGGLP